MNDIIQESLFDLGRVANGQQITKRKAKCLVDREQVFRDLESAEPDLSVRDFINRAVLLIGARTDQVADTLPADEDAAPPPASQPAPQPASRPAPQPAPADRQAASQDLDSDDDDLPDLPFGW